MLSGAPSIMIKLVFPTLENGQPPAQRLGGNVALILATIKSRPRAQSPSPRKRQPMHSQRHPTQTLHQPSTYIYQTSSQVFHTPSTGYPVRLSTTSKCFSCVVKKSDQLLVSIATINRFFF